MQAAAHNRKNGSPKSSYRSPVGVIGMGQMGAGIAVCLLTAGHPVAAVETDGGTRDTARRRVLALLRESQRNGLPRRDATQLIRRLGISAGIGFYRYTPEEAKRWEQLFTKFSYEIRALAQKYPDHGASEPSRVNALWTNGHQILRTCASRC